MYPNLHAIVYTTPSEKFSDDDRPSKYFCFFISRVGNGSPQGPAELKENSVRLKCLIFIVITLKDFESELIILIQNIIIYSNQKYYRHIQK